MTIDTESIRKFIETAVPHYSKSAPAVSQYLDELYIRIDEEPESVSLLELLALNHLFLDGEWEHPNYAQNRIYKTLDKLGKSTSKMLISY